MAYAPLHAFMDWILLFARIILGSIMIYYGWPKIKDLKSNAADFVEMGFRPGIFWGTIVAALEFFGGIFIILGIYVWSMSGLFAIEMLGGTIWKITKTDKKFPDWSYDLALLVICLLLLVTGAGEFVIFI